MKIRHLGVCIVFLILNIAFTYGKDSDNTMTQAMRFNNVDESSQPGEQLINGNLNDEAKDINISIERGSEEYGKLKNEASKNMKSFMIPFYYYRKELEKPRVDIDGNEIISEKKSYYREDDDKDDSDDELKKKDNNKKSYVEKQKPLHNINLYQINNEKDIKSVRQNESYIKFKNKHKADIKQAMEDLDKINEDKVEDHNEEENKTGEACHSLLKDIFFDHIDFDSKYAKIPDSTIRAHCQNIDMSCCTTNELQKRFESVSQIVDLLLIDLKLMYDFFNYLKQKPDSLINNFIEKNYGKIDQCTALDSEEFLASLYEFKQQANIIMTLYWNYIKTIITELYSMQCAICNRGQQNNFVFTPKGDIEIKLSFEELFNVAEKVNIAIIINRIFAYADFLECFALNNNKPVSFSFPKEYYTVRGFIEKKINYVPIDIKSSKKFEPSQEDLDAIPQEVNIYISNNHVIFGSKVVEWGRIKQMTQLLLEGDSASDLNFSKLSKRIDPFELKEIYSEQSLEDNKIKFSFKANGFDMNKSSISTNNKYVNNDFEDLKFIRLYNGTYLAHVLELICLVLVTLS